MAALKAFRSRRVRHQSLQDVCASPPGIFSRSAAVSLTSSWAATSTLVTDVFSTVACGARPTTCRQATS
eukprot:356742-Chlamydomonas_euryale.AAC.2